MRLWTIHPRYLDPQGLVALWREALLAQAVLRGSTLGYRHHPQLQRFRAHRTPRSAISKFLHGIWIEASSRGYRFDATKIGPVRNPSRVVTTTGQLAFEWDHLQRKLRTRCPHLFRRYHNVDCPDPHPFFRVVPGPVEPWERSASLGRT